MSYDLIVNGGHGPRNDGGFDPGAIGPRGTREADITNYLDNKVAECFQALGGTVGLVVQDGDLEDIVSAANSIGAKFFLSIHCDSFVTEDAHGYTVFDLCPGGEGEKLAKAIDEELAAAGLFNRGVKSAKYYVLRKTSMPAALVEIGFISNPAEEALMQQKEWLDKVAGLIAMGVWKALGRTAPAEPVKTPVHVVNVQPISQPAPAQTPFSFPNNARATDDLYIRDAKGTKIPGRWVSNGDRITVLDVSYSKQLALVEYPTASGVRKGYVRNVCIQYINLDQWHNGSTPEAVLDESGAKIGSLNPREAATPLYRKNGKLHVVYSTDKGQNTKSGYVAYNGGFTKF